MNVFTKVRADLEAVQGAVSYTTWKPRWAHPDEARALHLHRQAQAAPALAAGADPEIADEAAWLGSGPPHRHP